MRFVPGRCRLRNRPRYHRHRSSSRVSLHRTETRSFPSFSQRVGGDFFGGGRCLWLNFLPKSSSSETGRMWQRLIFTEKRRWPICSRKEELIRSRLMFSFRAFDRRKKEKKNLAFSRREANIITSSSLEFASLLFPSISSSPPARVFEVNRSPKISASTGKSPAASAG